MKCMAVNGGTPRPQSFCALCGAAASVRTLFALANRLAVGTIVGEKVSIASFCPAGCYLNEIPLNCCARA
jgi:hypothetical protein